MNNYLNDEVTTSFSRTSLPTHSIAHIRDEKGAMASPFFTQGAKRRRSPYCTTKSVGPDQSFPANSIMDSTKSKEVIIVHDSKDDSNGGFGGGCGSNDKDRMPVATKDEVKKLVPTTPPPSITNTAVGAKETERRNQSSQGSNNDNTSTHVSTSIFAKLAFKQDDTKNPFAQFAFRGASSTGSKNTLWKPTSHILTNESNRVNSKPMKQKAMQSATQSDKKSTKTKPAKSKCSEYIQMKDCNGEKQQKIVRKWHSMVVDQDASLQDRRFQIFVAVRLHARCQEKTTRQAMKSLSKRMNLTVDAMAGADPESFVEAISNLQYHNTKAKHLVKAAQEIKIRHGCIVPEREHALKRITGIGPVLADLLAFVNTEAVHKEQCIMEAAVAEASLDLLKHNCKKTR